LEVRGAAPHPAPPTYYHIRTIHHIAVTTVLRSWRWAHDCPEHVELIQRSIKLLMLHLVGHLCYSPMLTSGLHWRRFTSTCRWSCQFSPHHISETVTQLPVFATSHIRDG